MGITMVRIVSLLRTWSQLRGAWTASRGTCWELMVCLGSGQESLLLWMEVLMLGKLIFPLELKREVGESYYVVRGDGACCTGHGDSQRVNMKNANASYTSMFV